MRRFGGGGCVRLALLLLLLPACCLAAAPLGSAAAAQSQAGLTLDQLMQLLAQRKNARVSFAETDYLAILDRPVKSSGVLLYEAPDHLEKRTLQPQRQALVVQGDELTVQRGHRTYRLQMSAYPQVAPYVDAVRDTLAGNGPALQQVFKVALTGTLGGWRLELVPLDEAAARKVRRVTIAGTRDVIRSIEILQADGDRSVMTLAAPSAGSGAAR